MKTRALVLTLPILLFTNLTSTAVRADDPCIKALTPAVGSQLHMPDVPELNFYEAYRTLRMDPELSFDKFQPQEGIFLKRGPLGHILRNPDGSPEEASIRVLTDNPGESVSVIGDFNNWGKDLTAEQMKPYQLHVDTNTRYHVGVIPGLKHGQNYRLVVNGKQLLDPASNAYSQGQFQNSVFWDSERPGAYKMKFDAPDLRRKHVSIGEVELHSLVAKFPFPGGGGEVPVEKTFAAAADPLFADKFKETFQYNAVHVLPINQSIPGIRWQYRYQVYGNFAVDSQFGNEDDFAKFCDAMNERGIAVIIDHLGSHVPYRDGLTDIGLDNWIKGDGTKLFTAAPTEWGTKRYDELNPYLRRFKLDGLLYMFKRYHLGGVRIDNVGGIMQLPGGPEALRELVTEIRKYKPDAYIQMEDFVGSDRTQSLAQGGLGGNGRNGSTYFGWFRDNAQKAAEHLDMNGLRNDIRNLWGWNEEEQIPYITNHDEAAQHSTGATGQYPVSEVDGGGDFHSYGKELVFNDTAASMLGASEDTPQARLLQRGNFSDNPDVEWSRLNDPVVANHVKFEAARTKYINEHPEFATENLHPNVENHTDYDNKLMSFLRVNRTTGKRIYVLHNYGPNSFHNYQFGVDGDGPLIVKLDSDSKDFGGSNQLENAAPNGALKVSTNGIHGKSHSVAIPYVAPYSSIYLEM